MNQPPASATNINTEAGPSVFSRLKGIVDSDESDSADEKRSERQTQRDFDVREKGINENKKKRQRVNNISDEDDAD